MYTKVLEVQGTRTEIRGYKASFELYPEGTTRVVKQYNIFPKTLNGQRSGWFSAPRILQRAEIWIFDGAPEDSLDLHYNRWKDVRFLDDVLDSPTQTRA